MRFHWRPSSCKLKEWEEVPLSERWHQKPVDLFPVKQPSLVKKKFFLNNHLTSGNVLRIYRKWGDIFKKHMQNLSRKNKSWLYLSPDFLSQLSSIEDLPQGRTGKMGSLSAQPQSKDMVSIPTRGAGHQHSTSPPTLRRRDYIPVTVAESLEFPYSTQPPHAE